MLSYKIREAAKIVTASTGATTYEAEVSKDGTEPGRAVLRQRAGSKKVARPPGRAANRPGWLDWYFRGLAAAGRGGTTQTDVAF